MQITLQQAFGALDRSDKPFAELFRHGTLSVEIYKPVGRDLQQPHEQDEVYIVISGSGDFYLDGQVLPFQIGDLLFVPAGVEHRFLNFTEDFAVWVVFYGPKGGER
jgi:mannose-6-phosphate isomerase-like protein (cupin superfamily)